MDKKYSHHKNVVKPTIPAPTPVSASENDEKPVVQLKALVETCLAAFPLQPDTPVTGISFGLLTAYSTIPFDVPFDHVADFINAVGAASVQAGLVDVQFCIAKRASKAASDLQAIYGVTVDVDRVTADIVGEVGKAGLPMPTFVFESTHGFKLAYVSIRPIASPVFAEQAQRATLAFEGGDERSWDPGQMQRLPTCLRASEQGIVPVNFNAIVTNAVPLEVTNGAMPFPSRVLRALGAGALGSADRDLVRDYLEDLGMPVPDEPGSVLCDVCPDANHASKKCYVNVADDGAISVHCLGGHDGEGAKHWNECDLAELAGVHADSGGSSITRFDPLTHLPVTPGAVRFIEFTLKSWPAAQVKAIKDLWMHERARREAEAIIRGPGATEDEVLVVYRQRLQGVHGLAAMAAFYDRGGGQLVHTDPEHRALAVTTKSGPNLKANAIELKSSALLQLIWAKNDNRVFEYMPGWGPDAASLLHKLAVGHVLVLAKMGVPAVTTYTLPVAHVTESWVIRPGTLHIEGITVRESFDDVTEIDALEFFLGLFRAGRLPLRSENDVRLFVMLVATPLLRHVAPGLLGVFWCLGAPGAGKDYVAEMPRRIWEACASVHTRVSFDISLAGDLEQKRSLEMAAGCIYARAKEAGKRPGMTEALIRLAGTDNLPGRGLYKDEISIPNTFTYVAESAEDLPERREISRRTTIIHVSFMDDTFSKGEVLDEVRAASKGIIKNLKRIVETRPPEWYLGQSDTGSRPVIPVALAQLFGATLPAVEGEDLTEVYESMLAFTKDPEGTTHGTEQLATLKKRRADKVSLEAKTFPSYNLPYFIALMTVKPGKSELFSPYAKKSRELVNRIQRETDYRKDTAEQGYMTIEIGGAKYALRIEDGRRFILVPEVEFITKRDAARATAAAKSDAVPPSVRNITPAASRSAASEPATPVDPNGASFQTASATLLKKKAP